MDVLLGTVVMALGLVPTSKRLFGRIFPKLIPSCRDLVSPSNHTLDQVKVDREGLAFDIQDIVIQLWFLGSDWASRCVRIKVIDLRGTGSGVVSQGQGLRPNGPGALPRTISQG